MNLKYFSLGLFLLCFGGLGFVASNQERIGIKRSLSTDSTSLLINQAGYGAIAKNTTSCCFDIESLQPQLQGIQNITSVQAVSIPTVQGYQLHESSQAAPVIEAAPARATVTIDSCQLLCDRQSCCAIVWGCSQIFFGFTVLYIDYKHHTEMKNQ